MHQFIIKMDRVAAWVLLTAFLLYFISGYGMTKGIIDGELASALHSDWLAAIGITAFVIHASWAIHLAFKRWNLWNNVSKYFLVAVFFLIFFGLFYLNYFYENRALTPGVENTGAETQSQNQIMNSETTVYTKETLAKFNGLNGQSAYVALNGVVYDVSSLYVNGFHNGCAAGQDVTGRPEFQSIEKHSAEMLKRFKIVGTYAK